MLETMLALKNNDMRKIPGYDPEPVERLRKLQRTLVGDDGTRLTFHLLYTLVKLQPGSQESLLQFAVFYVTNRGHQSPTFIASRSLVLMLFSTHRSYLYQTKLSCPFFVF